MITFPVTISCDAEGCDALASARARVRHNVGGRVDVDLPERWTVTHNGDGLAQQHGCPAHPRARVEGQ